MRNAGTRAIRAMMAGLVAAAFVAVAALPATSAAEPRAKVSVTVIHAKKGPPHLHDALKPMWDTLRQSFGDKFSYFDVVDTASRSVEAGNPVEVRLPNGQRFAAIYNGVTPEKGLLRINVEMDDFRTKVRIHDGGVFFQAGRKHEGGILVVAVRAALLKD